MTAAEDVDFLPLSMMPNTELLEQKQDRSVSVAGCRKLRKIV